MSSHTGQTPGRLFDALVSVLHAVGSQLGAWERSDLFGRFIGAGDVDGTGRIITGVWPRWPESCERMQDVIGELRGVSSGNGGNGR